MKNLYWKRIYMNMNDGQEPILNWGTQLVYCPETPRDTKEEVKDTTDLAVKIVSRYINGSIKRGVFDRRIKKIHIENMKYWKGEDYKPEKISYPIFRETPTATVFTIYNYWIANPIGKWIRISICFR